MHTTRSVGTWGMGLVGIVTLLLGAPRARAQEEAWHFTTDDSRHARVDDRGGLGEGYSFSIDYDPDDGNSEDFCPHCRLTILVSDPGIDLAELSHVGIERSDLASAGSLLSTLQSVAAADPTGLAMELAPGLAEADLAAYVAQIEAIQARIGAIVTALETFAALEDGSFDWSAATLDTLRDALSLHMDTAFRAEFSDPNDPRIHNSGVAVYGLADLIAGLAGQGVPMDAQTAIQEALSSVPGLSGPVEISGDDDDVMQPASFHGYRTDLTVHQRTYAVNGFSAYLVVYTIANETTRVMPLVEVSMMADFDIPPLSYDTATEFDPALSMVAVYDTIPYTMPEEHYWFGLAPARSTSAAGQFVFANWNIDQNMTLAQFGSSTTDDNRYRFFLWDPAISGDHDAAVGKSEKQGAVSMLLDGPLLPGDQRSVAFCYAAGAGGSNGAARADLTAMMTACRALYTTLDPMCGDGTRTYPEECDGGPECSADCHVLRCGDTRVSGTEECDDGNTDAGDGCNASCVREICGNAVLDAGEECDDGNPSNSDVCLTDCTAARCGDGYERAATACTGADCGCAGYDHCLTGQFTLSTIPAGSFFEPLAGVPVSYRIGFDVAATDTTTLAAQNGIRVTTGPMHVEMSGAPLATSIARGLEGQTWTLDLLARPALGTNPFSTSRVQGIAGRTTVGFELFAAARGVTFSLDRLGRPLLSTLQVRSGTARLTVVPPRGLPTDVASGTTRASVGTVPAGGGGELCDDGNASDFDACTSACVPAACGDGIVQASEGEECDGGPMPPSWCGADCRRVGSSCGNGMLEAAQGEECDDANMADDDGCSATCRMEGCGDGVVQSGEECDDGANGDGDGCTDACVLEICGDSVVQPGEECDEGSANGDTAACTSTCAMARCGDSLTRAGEEQCDDGNDAVGDGCAPDCRSETCGDGRPGPSEECDDGNTAERDGCSPECRFEICGDGRPGPDEQCDDGNVVDGDGCDKDCLLENLAACGDGLVGTGEQCDDGARAAGDGCDGFCQLEDPEACGDGTVDPGESCDDGNTEGGDGCNARCGEERCGDGVQATGESCDDGNEVDGDGCSALCEVEPSECGNGVQELGEQCDGGADCDAMCRATGPAMLAETCGDGDLDFGEQCDDGDRRDGNGCDELCQLEASTCGNARLERGERCDDGNDEEGDGCDASCALEGSPMPPTPRASGGCGGCAVPARGDGAPLGALGLVALGIALIRRRIRVPR